VAFLAYLIFQHGPYDVQKTRRLAGQENGFLAFFPQKKTPSFILSYKKRHQIGLSFLSQAATYRPVSSNWPFFFSQAATYRPVLQLIYKKSSDKASEISKSHLKQKNPP
jgi:hypothetical protein